MEGGLLLYVAGFLFVTSIVMSTSALLFDDGSDSRWIVWAVRGGLLLCVAGHLVSGGLL